MSSEAVTVAEKQTGKIPLWVKVGYGGFEGADGMIISIFYAYFMFFATDVVGLSAAAAGLIMMFSALGDAISDPVTGIITDKVNTRWGRRRPILLAVALPYGFATWLLFTDPGWGEAATVAYFSVLVVLFYTLIDFVWTPGLALGAEMTLDYDERTSLASYRSAWDMILGLLGASTCLLVAKYFTDGLGNAKAGWSAMAAFYGLIAVFPVLLTWRVTRGYERYREKSPEVKLKAIWAAISKNKSFLNILGVFFFAGAASYFLMSLGVYWYTYYFGYNEVQIGILMGSMGIGPIIWVPIANWLGRKFGKKKAMMIISSIVAASYAGLWFLRPLGGNAEMPLIATLIIASIGIGPAIMLISGAMIADAVEVDEFRSGERREGLYFSVCFFMQKIGTSFVLWLSGIVLERAGYVAGAAQGASALTAIRALVSWGPAALVLVSMVFVWRNPMTKERHGALLRAIELKKAGKNYDVEAIKDLL